MVFYFTATGNCLYAARHFSDAPVSIPQVMRGTQRQFSDDTIGIVCPVYAGEPPKMVKQFLRESSFQTNYFYFILACAQNCPQKAIGLRIADKNPKARYRNPHISLQEIIDANRNS